jgi:hypothetical protein
MAKQIEMKLVSWMLRLCLIESAWSTPILMRLLKKCFSNSDPTFKIYKGTFLKPPASSLNSQSEADVTQVIEKAKSYSSKLHNESQMIPNTSTSPWLAGVHK